MGSVHFFFFFQAEDGIRDYKVTGVQTCALPICRRADPPVRGGGPLTRRLLWRARAGGAAAGGPSRRHPRYGLGLPVPGQSSGRRGAEHRRGRSEERRVGKEWRSRRRAWHDEEGI